MYPRLRISEGLVLLRLEILLILISSDGDLIKRAPYNVAFSHGLVPTIFGQFTSFVRRCSKRCLLIAGVLLQRADMLT
jgi:hypothetical protein